MKGTCRFCACTMTTPCAGGCAWTDAEETLCTVCADAVETAAVLVDVLPLAINLDPVLELAQPITAFDALPVAGQRRLVAFCRTLVERMRSGISVELQEEAGDAIHQIDRISAFLLEHCPQEVGEDDSAAAVVLRLLGRTLGSPLVLP